MYAGENGRISGRVVFVSKTCPLSRCYFVQRQFMKGWRHMTYGRTLFRCLQVDEGLGTCEKCAASYELHVADHCG
jgi:hypothetical protein